MPPQPPPQGRKPHEHLFWVTVFFQSQDGARHVRGAQQTPCWVTSHSPWAAHASGRQGAPFSHGFWLLLRDSLWGGGVGHTSSAVLDTWEPVAVPEEEWPVVVQGAGRISWGGVTAWDQVPAIPRESTFQQVCHLC